MALDSQRIGIAALVLSASGLVYIAQREGYSDKAYPDPVHGKAVATLGYGSTGGVKMGDTTTPVRALVRLRADAAEVEVALRKCLAVPMYQREWDAFVGLAYNTGATAVCKNNARTGPSTLAQRLQAGDYAGACDAIMLYDKAGPVHKPQDRCSHPDNRTCRGVWADRQRLRAMCLGVPAP
ncbi:lysozyme [Extensimonas vulgaris]|uniref:Lysozyme n=1 Tax=Extensimonas vulgaris TaxID=1031594 RepID=A0A369AR58_9BURK|nr:lysozyme [Extensimonas vulgaris]RCX10726.1 GH24 family phage-related lysozyme (muramidase) [Extensimonas vulgaris]TWI41368.1 GH24 family phage-related lysozyme (muramidase) [Extensimonas vulgaris]TXD16835.1 lysozyme [Extensimonas vulgaris]